MSRGQCRDCERRREVYPISRQGGGTYRRGGRQYRSSICAECAIGLLRHARGGGQSSVSRWSIVGLDRVVSRLGTLEAAEVFTAWRDRREHARWLREAGLR